MKTEEEREEVRQKAEVVLRNALLKFIKASYALDYDPSDLMEEIQEISSEIFQEAQF